MMTDIVDAARYMIYVSYKGEQYTLTNLKLQKMLYLVQGWSFLWDGRPAFQGDFVLWSTGPVSPKVHAVFSVYGRNEIPESEGIPSLPDKDVEETIDAVWRDYGRKNAYDIAVFVKKKLIPDNILSDRSGPVSDRDIDKIFHRVFSQ